MVCFLLALSGNVFCANQDKKVFTHIQTLPRVIKKALKNCYEFPSLTFVYGNIMKLIEYYLVGTKNGDFTLIGYDDFFLGITKVLH